MRNLALRIAALIVSVSLNGCATRPPVNPGMLLTISPLRPHLATNHSPDKTTLQVHWLGTACYLLQLDDRVIFTDPFLTHQSLARVILGGTLKSNPEAVRNKLAHLPIPQAVFVGHSHYDHLLDAAECLQQPGWNDVPIYGSLSTLHILRTYGESFTNSWRRVITNSGWQVVAPGIRYQAVNATHARQLPLLPLLYPGEVRNRGPRTSRRACDFKVGDTYAYVFELSNDQVTNTIYFVGAAHQGQDGFPPSSVDTVDVAILCVPTWKRAKDYPANLIQRLKPQYILASHHNNFFQVNNKPHKIVALADLKGFLIRAQEVTSYSGFKSILVPSVGTVLRIKP